MKLTRAIARRVFAPASRHLLSRWEQTGPYHIVGPKPPGQPMPALSLCGVRREGLSWVDPGSGRADVCEACWSVFEHYERSAREVHCEG